MLGFVSLVRSAVLGIAVVAALFCALDWAVRTRRVSPFSAAARFSRRYLDPLMRPIERMLLRSGGSPTAAPWWMLAAVIVGGLVLLQVIEVAGGLVAEVGFAATHPTVLPMLLLSWAISLLTRALLVRVFSSWFSISPYSPWIRWSYVLTDWMLTCFAASSRRSG